MTRAEAEAKIIAGEYEGVLAAVERGKKDAERAEHFESIASNVAMRLDDAIERAEDAEARAEKAERIVAVVKKFTVDNGSSLSVLQTMATLSRVIEREEGKC